MCNYPIIFSHRLIIYSCPVRFFIHPSVNYLTLFHRSFIHPITWLFQFHGLQHLLTNCGLQVKLVKVSAHSDDMLNTQADALAQAAHISSQPTFSPMVLYQVPCILTFNSLPIDMNVRHFLRSIGDARNFLSFCSLAR